MLVESGEGVAEVSSRHIRCYQVVARAKYGFSIEDEFARVCFWTANANGCRRAIYVNMSVPQDSKCFAANLETRTNLSIIEKHYSCNNHNNHNHNKHNKHSKHIRHNRLMSSIMHSPIPV